MANPWDPLPRPTKSSTADQIHLAVGRALTQWERLEYRVSLLYAAIVSPKQFSPPAVRAFGTVASSSARADMTAAAVRAYDFPSDKTDLKDRLLKFLRTFGSFSARRNEIAHGVASTAKIDGVDLGVLLLPAFYNSRKFNYEAIGTPVYMYGSDEINFYRDHFTQLVLEADALIREVEALAQAELLPPL